MWRVLFGIAFSVSLAAPAVAGLRSAPESDPSIALGQEILRCREKDGYTRSTLSCYEGQGCFSYVPGNYATVDLKEKKMRLNGGNWYVFKSRATGSENRKTIFISEHNIDWGDITISVERNAIWLIIFKMSQDSKRPYAKMFRLYCGPWE